MWDRDGSTAQGTILELLEARPESMNKGLPEVYPIFREGMTSQGSQEGMDSLDQQSRRVGGALSWDFYGLHYFVRHSSWSAINRGTWLNTCSLQRAWRCLCSRDHATEHCLTTHSTTWPLELLQKPVQLLLDAGERILPHVIDASLLPFSPFFLGTQLLDLLFDGNLENRHGQVNLGRTSRQKMVSGAITG